MNMATNKIIPFTDQELSILEEEYITQQRKEFTLKGLYAYVVYWAMEERRISGDQLQEEDKERINNILERIIREGRIVAVFDNNDNNKRFMKQ